MKEVVALVRKHSPGSKIVLGGYGTVAPDEMLLPYGDHVCREEGVAFMRRLLGEPEIPMPYRHPMIINPLRVFGKTISRTGIVFGGLGCPNGCDFCCTSHFFDRKHIRLLPTGADIYHVVERYHEVDPNLSILILDEDFLLNRRRAMEFRDCVMKAGKPLSIFVFASIKALSQYTVTEILEMGIDGMWIGYEGTRSGYAKQSGRPVDELFNELRQHGITILASMIVGFPYQTPEIIEEELSGLLALKPVFSQFLIYGPCPGTPFYEKVVREGTLIPEVKDNKELFFLQGTGFHSMVQHPTMSSAGIEAAQQRCFEEEFRRLGPSIYRSVARWFEGYLTLRGSPNPLLRAKAEQFASDIRKAYPSFLAGRLFGPTREVRRWIAELQRRTTAELGRADAAGAHRIRRGRRARRVDEPHAAPRPVPAPAAHAAHVPDARREVRARLGAASRQDLAGGCVGRGRTEARLHRLGPSRGIALGAGGGAPVGETAGRDVAQEGARGPRPRPRLGDRRERGAPAGRGAAGLPPPHPRHPPARRGVRRDRGGLHPLPVSRPRQALTDRHSGGACLPEPGPRRSAGRSAPRVPCWRGLPGSCDAPSVKELSQNGLPENGGQG